MSDDDIISQMRELLKRSKNISKTPTNKPLFGRKVPISSPGKVSDDNSALLTESTNRITPHQEQKNAPTVISGSVKPPKKKLVNTQFKKILRIGAPVALDKSKFNKSKFKVEITFLDEEGKKKTRNVRFGEIGTQDYYEHKNEKIANAYCGRHNKYSDTPFHRNFWQCNLLNHQSGDLSQAFGEICKRLIKF